MDDPRRSNHTENANLRKTSDMNSAFHLATLDAEPGDARLAGPAYRPHVFHARDWVPPQVLRTPAHREPPLPRNDLKPQLTLSRADLKRVQRIGPTGDQPAQATPEPKAPRASKTPWRGGNPNTRYARIEAWLQKAPPTQCYTAEEIAEALHEQVHKVRSFLYHAPKWMPSVEWRIIHHAKGRIAQYRIRSANRWPQLPPGTRKAIYSHAVSETTGEP